jgi:hypothetical protein
VSDKEESLLFHTSLILGKDTSQMTLIDIIEELIQVIIEIERDDFSLIMN